MNILFLTQVLPYPLDAGPKVRSYYVLRYLAQKHRVTLVSFVRGEQEHQHADHLRSFLHAVYTVPIQRSFTRDAFFLAQSIATHQPFLITRDHVPAMHATINRLRAENDFDAVHADQLWMAQYTTGANGARKILDQHNAVWTIVYRMGQNARYGPWKWLMAREWRALQQYEARACREFDHVLTVTAEDARALRALDPDSRVPMTVLPICLDPAAVPRIERAPDARHVICVGGMFYPPNVDGVTWFARECFPRVKQMHPTTDFLVVGARPAKALLALGHRNPSVRVLGYVADTRPYLAASAVFVVPLRAGGGMRVKILDAWARGIPIVSTTIGCEGIEVCDGENILIADTPRDFADAVARVMQDRALAQRLADNGRQWLEAKYDWRVEYRKLDAVYPN